MKKFSCTSPISLYASNQNENATLVYQACMSVEETEKASRKRRKKATEHRESK
jgi:hypothetical protein